MGKKKTSPVDIEVVIDRSGSMGLLVDDAIGGYNQWLADQQAIPGAAQLTLTLFDHEINTLPQGDLKNAVPLTRETYVPRGSTALNDAIGRAANRLLSRNPDKAILVVLTDGQENASTEYTQAKVKELVQQAQDKGWQVVYLSTDISGFAHGTLGYGVKIANTMQAAHTSAGIRTLAANASAANTSYRSK